jgi:endo-1,4-beta-xylanase
MNKYLKYFTFVFIFIVAGTLKAQSVLSYNFDGFNIGDPFDHISWSPSDIQSVVSDDPLSSGNKVLKNTVHNYNAAPVLMFVLPAGKTLADYDSLTFRGYFQKGDVGYKGIVAQVYQTKPTGHFLDTDTLGIYNRASGVSTSLENLGIYISNTSSFSDTIYIAFGINCAGTSGTDTTTWFADDVQLVAKAGTLPPPPPPTAEIVTNGGFEDSPIGIDTTGAIKGWLFQVASGISSAPEFEIVSDTVQEGTRALKVIVHGLGTNQWDIQAVNDSIHVTPGVTYNYSIWAKADNPGAQVNFTVGNYSYSEYGAIRPANLTTQWKKYTMTFTVNDGQTIIRAPIHFNYAGDVNNSIYVDNLKIADVNESKKPIIVEAESGTLGSNFSVAQSNGITYITANTNYTGLTSPGDSSRVATYQVTFQDSGWYNLFVRLRVGSGTFDDDSYFYGRGFGVKNDTASTDWVFINGLASAGFTDSSAVVDGPGTAGSQVWKWANVTNNSYQGTPGDSFYVSIDSLTRTFQIGSRENGLDIDKMAFGKSNLFYTVYQLDNVLPGSANNQVPDSSLFWKGPALAEGQAKFLGSAYGSIPDNVFNNYWTQLTPDNAGKWGSVAASQDTNQWNWNGLNTAYNYAKSHNLIFKDHCLIWGQQQPSWISALDSAQQISYIETWIRMVGQKYPDMDMIDVVNEPLTGHNPPDGLQGRANYIKALGGAGATGWDWVIKSFQLARQYLPNTKLLINDYNIINSNSATTNYLVIINLLKDRGLIDGIGVQGHRFSLENADTNTIKGNLLRLGATGLPVYVSELDLGNIGDAGTPDDNTQLQLYQKIFPILWKSPAVQGITLWGYLEGQMWQTTCFLVHANGEARPAFAWLAQYVKDNPTGIEKTASTLPTKYELDQNYPNPFNPSTKIRYSIVTASRVTLKLYDILGREVQTLVNEEQVAGQYTLTFNAQNLASGIYFYQITAGNFTATKKLMLLK